MSSVNYSLNHRGVRLIPSSSAWITGKTGKLRLNPKYKFVGKVEITMPNILVTASDKQKPKYRGDVGNLNRTAKEQLVSHFYDNTGKRNKKTVAYFGIRQSDIKPVKIFKSTKKA